MSDTEVTEVSDTDIRRCGEICFLLQNKRFCCATLLFCCCTLLPLCQDRNLSVVHVTHSFLYLLFKFLGKTLHAMLMWFAGECPCSGRECRCRASREQGSSTTDKELGKAVVWWATLCRKVRARDARTPARPPTCLRKTHTENTHKCEYRQIKLVWVFEASFLPFRFSFCLLFPVLLSCSNMFFFSCLVSQVVF